jgi:hypothetical protein
MGRDAAYYRAWRAAHPHYRARQNVIRNLRRVRGDRTAEYAKRASRAVSLEPLPSLHQGHPLFDAARAIVGRRGSSLVTLYDPLPDDPMSEAVLALLEGSDPREAVRRYRATELSWGRITAPLIGEWA